MKFETLVKENEEREKSNWNVCISTDNNIIIKNDTYEGCENFFYIGR